jgi:hypothetical protein
MKDKANLILGLTVAVMLFAMLFGWRGYERTWAMWGLPVGMQRFLDLRVIMEGADAYQQGLDPMDTNPTDINQRPVNYPRVWHLLYRLGLDRTDTTWVGLVLWGASLAGLVLVIPPQSLPRTLCLLAAFFSPAIMLGYERGNTDLLVFALLAVAIVQRRAHWAMLVVLAAFVLKLYPLAGLAVLLSHPREQAWRCGLVALGFAGLYLLYNFNDLRLISANTPRDVWLSYGINVLWMKVAATGPEAGRLLRWLSWAVVVLLAVAAGRRAVRASGAGEPATAAFRVGAACYVGTFLLGNNFDYRFICVLPVLPQLLSWASTGLPEFQLMARLAIAGLFISLWSIAIERAAASLSLPGWVPFLLGQAARWGLLGSLTMLFAASLPDWARDWRRTQPLQAAGSAP